MEASLIGTHLLVVHHATYLASPNAKGPTLPVAHAIKSPEFPGHSIHWTAWMIADKTNPNKIAYDSTLR